MRGARSPRCGSPTSRALAPARCCACAGAQSPPWSRHGRWHQRRPPCREAARARREPWLVDPACRVTAAAWPVLRQESPASPPVGVEALWRRLFLSPRRPCRCVHLRLRAASARRSVTRVRLGPRASIHPLSGLRARPRDSRAAPRPAVTGWRRCAHGSEAPRPRGALAADATPRLSARVGRTA